MTHPVCPIRVYRLSVFGIAYTVRIDRAGVRRVTKRAPIA